tara:strand:+ start:1991 stop:3379 length:1389 start_codon:yes stop_codon:yes gene_type:complete
MKRPFFYSRSTCISRFTSNLTIKSALTFSVIFTLTIALFLNNLQTVNAQDQSEFIGGKVINGTAGGIIPANIEVMLMSIDIANNRIIEQETTNIDLGGNFVFTNLKSGIDSEYRLVVSTDSYTPYVDMATVENWQDVQITIYEDTPSLENITINSYVMMIPTLDARNRHAGVLTVINVDNLGDKVWVPDLSNPNLTGLDLLRFNLPLGFTDLTIESELPNGNVLEIDSGFALTNPIPPGEAAILISYIVPYEGDSFNFNLKLPYGADLVRILLPADAGQISAEKVAATESVIVADKIFNQIEGENYVKGEELLIAYFGLPQPTPFQTLYDFTQSRLYLILLIGLVGTALLSILTWTVYSRRKNNDYREKPITQNRELLLAEIADIYDLFESDQITEREFTERSQSLKQLIIRLDKSIEINRNSTDSAPEPLRRASSDLSDNSYSDQPIDPKTNFTKNSDEQN